MSRVGIVIIGRNEGERLIRCLESAYRLGYPIVYVDSASTDKSIDNALERECHVIKLDMSKPFSAARARNDGFSYLRKMIPNIEFVQFIDGDCRLEQDWLNHGTSFLRSQLSFAVVCGRVREMFPQVSVYNRLLDLEWDKPTGDTESCGGIALVRADAFLQVGGFDPKVVAGEEPELCSRLRAQGWRIMRLAEPMASHDSAMLHFSQWWKRSLRTGYGGLAVYHRSNGLNPRPFSRSVRSARFWTLGWPLLVLMASLIGFFFNGPLGAAFGFAILFLMLPTHLARVTLRRWKADTPLTLAMQYAFLITVAKIPEMIGQFRFLYEQKRGVTATIIEHKVSGASNGS